MDNQHRQIKGYRELNQDEIDLMNEVKELGPRMEAVVKKLRASGSKGGADGQGATPAADQRWVSIGETHLQQGLMALTRAVAKPGFF